jgi:hypothetical protein
MPGGTVRDESDTVTAAHRAALRRVLFGLVTGGAVAGTWISLFDAPALIAVPLTAVVVLAYRVVVAARGPALAPGLVVAALLLGASSVVLAAAVGYEMAPRAAARPVAVPTATPRDQPAPSAPTTVPVTPTTMSPPPPATVSPKPTSLLDLPYEAGDSKPGLAQIGTKRFERSFRTQLCFNYPIVVPLGGTYRTFAATVGYSAESDSTSAGVHLQVEVTLDPPDAANAVWQRVEEVALASRGNGQQVVATLPDGATALRLSATHYACSTEIVWGDPVVR